jgi:hypothetical protein
MDADLIINLVIATPVTISAAISVVPLSRGLGRIRK